MKIIHICDECGEEITGETCESHPDSPVISLIVEENEMERESE